MKLLRDVMSHDDKYNPNADCDRDHEAEMAIGQLRQTCDNARKLMDMIDPDGYLDGWVAAKITLAADYIDRVYHYMDNQMNMDDQHCDDEKM